MKVLGSALARQHFAAGLAGPDVPLPDAPRPVGLTSRICHQADIEADWLRHWCGVLRCAPIYHRKVWEDAYVLQALWEAGMLAEGRRGLGFAVGQEALPELLAARGATVVATDLDAGDPRARAWIGSGQHRAAGAGASPDDARLTRRPLDMGRIPDELAGGFDFLWSVCAFEHLGTLDRGLEFVLAAMRCLKPGGLAVHTTEYNLDDTGGTVRRGATVLYQSRHLAALAARLAAAGHELLPIAAPAAQGSLDGYIDLPPFAEAPSVLGSLAPPHLRLAFRGYPVTSVGLLIRAGGG